MVFKLTFCILFLLGMITTMPSCKSKKKCPDFTQVDGKVKVDRHGLVKKKKMKAPRTNQNF